MGEVVETHPRRFFISRRSAWTLLALLLVAAALSMVRPRFLVVFAASVVAGVLLSYLIPHVARNSQDQESRVLVRPAPRLDKPSMAIGVLRTLKVLAAVVGFYLLLLLCSLLLSRCELTRAIAPPPRISTRYIGELDASSDSPTLKETVILDKQFEEAIQRSIREPLPAGSPFSDLIVMSNEWKPASPIDGSPVYTRTTTTDRIASDGMFTVFPITIRIDLGYFDLRPHRDVFELRPAEGSTVTIMAPKGSIGKTDPATEKTLSLPGARRFEASSLKVGTLNENIQFEVLGSAWRNPAGRQLYDASSWGWLPWILGLLVLTCATLARDFLVERIKSLISRNEPTAEAARGQKGSDSRGPRPSRSSNKKSPKAKERRRRG